METTLLLLFKRMFRVIAFANTLGIVDLILHPLFHLWVLVAPHSYEWAMNLFVAGLHMQVTEFDSSWGHVVMGTVIEASAFWILGAMIALIYNRLARS